MAKNRLDGGMPEWREVNHKDTGEDYLATARFSSAEHVYDAISKHPKVDGARSSSTKGTDADWHGGMSFPDSENAARKGWVPGADKVREARARLHLSPASLVGTQRTLHRGIAGSRVDLGAYNSRRPDHMVKKRRTRTSDGTIVTLSMDCAASCGVSGKSMENRAIALATVVDALEARGVSCEVVAFFPIRPHFPGALIPSVVAKKAGFPINLERLVYVTGHPAVFRRAIFGVMERCPTTNGRTWMDTYGCGYGHPYNTPEAVVKALGSDYHIPSLHRDSIRWSEAGPVETDEWCLNTFNEIFRKKGIRS